MDLPLKFHELIPSLVSGIQHSQEAIQHQSTQLARDVFRTVQSNTMSALEALFGEISTQRLLVDKKYRNEITKLYLGKIVEHAFIPALDGDLNNESGMKYAINTSRVVSCMLLSSFSKLVEESSTSAIVEHTLGLIHKFLSHWFPSVLKQHDTCTPSILNTTDSGLTELLSIQCNLIVELQCNHGLAFDRYTDSFLRLFYGSFCSTFEDGAYAALGSSEPLVIAFLLFMANVASSHNNNTSPNGENANSRDHFFTPSILQTLTRQLLLLFSRHIYIDNSSEDDNNDREYWQDNPEAFYQWELQRSSEDDVGCAAENLFVALIESCGKNVMLPWLIALLNNVPAQQAVIGAQIGVDSGLTPETLKSYMPLGHSDINSNLETELIIQWNAVYLAAGLAGCILDSFGFHFGLWFDAIIGPGLTALRDSKQVRCHCCTFTLQQTSSPLKLILFRKSSLPIIQRRLVWLLSCNAHKVVLSSQHNPLNTIVSILSKHNNSIDTCVRLTVVQTLEALIPYCEEVPGVLQSIIEPVIPSIYELIGDCNELENRATCLELMSTLLTFVKVSGGVLSNNILNTIATPLSLIWENAVDQHLLLKRNVLDILSSLASYVGRDQAAILYPMALPMIDDCFQYDNYVFMVEDALRLWFVLLRLSSNYDSLIGKLFVHAGKLSQDLEHVM
jgi:hypothetical protein